MPYVDTPASTHATHNLVSLAPLDTIKNSCEDEHGIKYLDDAVVVIRVVIRVVKDVKISRVIWIY